MKKQNELFGVANEATTTVFLMDRENKEISSAAFDAEYNYSSQSANDWLLNENAKYFAFN